ncbi:uncharacterized protein, partial [Penaeus vannamei]|uniref:uncharacterized protein n=1 Tax=Penaeus vannamei TaxID=6689 RepID=UPI00387F40CE
CKDHRSARLLDQHINCNASTAHSTADLLLTLSSTWNQALNDHLSTCVIALAIAGTFECVCHQGLLEKLQVNGIGDKVLRLFNNCFTEQYLHVVLNGKSSRELPIDAGVPQGRVLGYCSGTYISITF